MSNHFIRVRPATLNDLPRLTEIQNHYIENTHITFDVRAFTPEQRIGWFTEHSDGQRYRVLVAEDRDSDLLGYVAIIKPSVAMANDFMAAIDEGMRQFRH